jgi:hypothetical protein
MHDCPQATHRALLLARRCIAAGHKTHWMNESTLRHWVDTVIWPALKADCESHEQDPLKAKSVIYIDCYPVHISQACRTLIKYKYKQFRLVNVPPMCTSKAQVADYLLIQPLNNYHVW